MKILFVVDKLEVGGTERSAVTLCNYWVNKGYDIYLIVIFSGKGKKPNQYVGRTPHLQPVHVLSSKNLVGKRLSVKLEDLTSYSFHGRLSA